MSSARVLSTAFTLALLAAGAHAQAQPSKAAKPHVASRDQLRECLERQADLRERKQSLEDGSAARAAEQGRLQREGARLREAKATLDPANAPALAAFRHAVDAFNADAVALNKGVEDASAAVEAYNTEVQSANELCDTLDYRARDVEAVLKERSKARAVATAASSSAN